MNSRLVIVAEDKGLARSVAIGPHHLTADEPEPAGTDTGPTPVELLLAALGSCASMAVRASAQRHAWPLERVDVAVRFDAEGQVVKNIGLVGELTSAQRDQLLAVAGRCPVHRLLAKEVTIITVPTLLAEPEPLP
ncbi:MULTISPECIES: OsmC family protein [unclassified Streptomyces]|uniref:OsmC family protein n=1 Tax=unclassified Streptomyces TaxID=2593676 RepID=UPI002E2AF4F7|nr:OsmC family protein [Streptomyces sp. NBC_00228]